jgi:hypothetical protein
VKLGVVGATVISLAAIILEAGPSGTQVQLPRPVDDPEAYAVYASVLRTDSWIRQTGAKTLVVRLETGTNWECVSTDERLAGEWRFVFENFKAENAVPRTLLEGFPLGVSYVVASSLSLEALFDVVPTDPWGAFYNRYPGSGGIMIVSAVGFDRTKQRAMAYVSRSYGLLGGNGRHHFLEKVEGTWRETRVAGLDTCLWES